MTQAIFESIFDVLYLCGVIVAGLAMFTKGKNKLIKKFGLMATLLGAGDAFHLVPRMYALWTTGLAANAAALGFGKFVTSITMTVFYLILYYIWRDRYNVKNEKNITKTIWFLAVARIALCLLPQNQWLIYKQPVFYAILRNIPFAIMGIIIVFIFNREIKRTGDPIFKHMPLAIILSFAFYIPVVLWGSVFPLVGILMIPKTLAYVWIVKMGWNLFQEEIKK